MTRDIPAPASANRPTILLVDDTQLNLELLKGFLSDEEFRLMEAHNGREAIELIAARPPDLILLDVMMPEMDGFTVCQRIRENPEWRAIPVIVLTVLNEVGDHVKAITSGADDFITKPFHPTVLLARVRSYLRAKQLADEVRLLNTFRHEMLRMVAHDLNNHMGAVLGYVELLEHRTDLPPSAHSQVQKALRSSEEAARLLHNFMALEKRESGSLTLACAPVDLAVLVRRAAALKEVVIGGGGLTVSLEGPDKLDCTCDADLVARVISNLLDNAVKFAPSGTTVAIHWAAINGRATFAICNHGPMIPAAEQTLVFDKFYQVKNRPELQPRGCGLGLAFCKMVTDAHGGEIKIVSPMIGQTDGVRVEVSLPQHATIAKIPPSVPTASREGGKVPETAVLAAP